MYDGRPTLFDQITFVHGPRDLLVRYVAFAEEQMRELGVQLKVSADFDRLIALNRQHRDSWPLLSPIFNPKFNDLAADDI